MIELLCERCNYPGPAHSLSGHCPTDGERSTGFRLVDREALRPSRADRHSGLTLPDSSGGAGAHTGAVAPADAGGELELYPFAPAPAANAVEPYPFEPHDDDALGGTDAAA